MHNYATDEPSEESSRILSAVAAAQFNDIDVFAAFVGNRGYYFHGTIAPIESQLHLVGWRRICYREALRPSRNWSKTERKMAQYAQEWSAKHLADHPDHYAMVGMAVNRTGKLQMAAVIAHPDTPVYELTWTKWDLADDDANDMRYFTIYRNV